ncbi:MAG: glutamyl-tRNA reductase [Cyanobacteria bacterium NC_groundwater_1444_Ag_S-0.65um_54_12]|nr:glutamyl-tRNA reductase [Cyanobacteria bacterium NC_groundwater_1444_Ag_S-0.65um_54_12]
MQIVQIGVSHQVAPLALRERVTFSSTEIAEALAKLAEDPRLAEVAMLSTCNRTELFAVTAGAARAREALRELLGEAKSLTKEELQCFDWRVGQSAITHLFRVAAGVESQIIGEGQILGQVRQAASLARQAGVLGPVLDSLFRHAVSAGKRVRSESGISQGAVSIGSAAVELASSELGGLAGKTILLIGAGKIAEAALRHVADQGCKRIIVANRTAEAAIELATAIGGEAISFCGVESALREVDVAFCCTGAPHYVLSRCDLAPIVVQQPERLLLLIDVSVPRNIDPDVRALTGIKLFDIDDLSTIAERHRARRVGLLGKVEEILAQELAHFDTYLRSYAAAPTITSLRQKIEVLRAVEFQRFRDRMGNAFSEEQLVAIEALTRSLANKFLHEPTIGLKNTSGASYDLCATAIRELFNLPALEAARVNLKGIKTESLLASG